MMESLNLFIGSIVALGVGALAFLTKRMIEQNDKRHEESKRSIKVLSGSIEEIKKSTKFLETEFLNISAEKRFGSTSQGRVGNSPSGKELEEIKRKVSKTVLGIYQIQKTIDEEIAPKIKDSLKTHGEIIWIKDEISSQNDKMRVMFEVVTKIVKSQKP